MVVSDKSAGLGKTDVHAQWLDGPVVRRKIHGVPAEVPLRASISKSSEVQGGGGRHVQTEPSDLLLCGISLF